MTLCIIHDRCSARCPAGADSLQPRLRLEPSSSLVPQTSREFRRCARPCAFCAEVSGTSRRALSCAVLPQSVME